MTNLTALFVWEMLGFVGLALLESTVEGPHGGGEGTYGWRKELLGYRIKEYHFWLWYVCIPIFVFSPLIFYGFEPRLFGTLVVVYLLGGVAEDFTYFIFNRNYGLKSWNSAGATWMPWYKVGRLEIPKFYVRNFVVAAAVYFLFILY